MLINKGPSTNKTADRCVHLRKINHLRRDNVRRSYQESRQVPPSVFKSRWFNSSWKDCRIILTSEKRNTILVTGRLILYDDDDYTCLSHGWDDFIKRYSCPGLFSFLLYIDSRVDCSRWRISRPLVIHRCCNISWRAFLLQGVVSPVEKASSPA